MAQAQNVSIDAVSGLQPLSYLNQNQPASVLFTKQKRAPTTNDRRFKFGTIWLDTATNTVYALVNVTNNAAIWSLLGSGSSDLETLTGDSGGAISPTSGNINILGGQNMNVAGSGSTLTVNSSNTTGIAVLAMGNATVLTSVVTSNSRIFLSYQPINGLGGTLNVSAITPGVSFNISTGSIGDTSVVSWMIVEPT